MVKTGPAARPVAVVMRIANVEKERIERMACFIFLVYEYAAY